MVDELDEDLTPLEIYSRGEQRSAQRAGGNVAAEFTRLRNELDLAVATKDLVVAENYRLRRIIEAQDVLLTRSIPKNEVQL